MQNKLTRAEQETHINIDAVEGYAIIDTSIPKDIKALKKKGYEIIKENYYSDGTVCNVIFKMPRSVLTFRSANTVKRKPSEKQKRSLEIARQHIGR